MSETTPNAGTPAVAGSPPGLVKSARAPGKRGGTRRFFLLALLGSWAAVGWTTLTGGLLGMVLGTVRFLFPNVLSEPPTKFKAGFPAEYEEGKVVVRYKDQHAWIVRNKDEKGRDTIYALSTTCTHLGCTPNWLEREQKFKCPCHGSGYYITGVNFEGPAPRPLERWAISVGDDGQIVVDEAKKFQQELGQWDNPESFLMV
jgi:cytochrome b6-f complex iron-sulfur subunit